LQAQTSDPQLLARDNMNNGVRAFREGNYEIAIADFRRALEADPNFTVAELYLAVAYSRQFMPGNESQQNQEWATQAIASFEHVLTKEPDNLPALNGLASIYQDTNQLQKARELYLKETQLDSQNPTSFYAVGSVDWLILQLKPSPPAEEQSQLIQEGLQNLSRALTLNPDYEDAMAYTNLLLREQAKRTTDPTEKKRLEALADAWFDKTLDTRKRNSLPASPGLQRLPYTRVQGSLISKPPLAYPPEARAARVQGVVLVEARIDENGNVAQARVLSGHELLTAATLENVKQWIFRPYLVNGKPHEIVTTITVNFALE